MYIDGQVKISRADNGYVVSMRDPKIEAANRKRDLKGSSPAPYIDPDKTYVFSEIGDLTAFLEKNLDKALPKADFDSSFVELASDDTGD